MVELNLPEAVQGVGRGEVDGAVESLVHLRRARQRIAVHAVAVLHDSAVDGAQVLHHAQAPIGLGHQK